MSGVPSQGLVPPKKEPEVIEEPEIRSYVPVDRLVWEACLLSGIGVAIAWITDGSVLAALVPIVFVALHVLTAKDKIHIKED
jgi:hypothetical protein